MVFYTGVFQPYFQLDWLPGPSLSPDFRGYLGLRYRFSFAVVVPSLDEFRQLDTTGLLPDDFGGCGTTQRLIRVKSSSLSLLQTSIPGVYLTEKIAERELLSGVVCSDRPDDLDRLLAAETTLHPDRRPWEGDDLDVRMITLRTPDPVGQTISTHPIVECASGAGRQSPA